MLKFGYEIQQQIRGQEVKRGRRARNRGTVKDYTGEGNNIVIPVTITSIGDHAFGFCEALKEITVPKAAKIDDFAFAECEVKIIRK